MVAIGALNARCTIQMVAIGALNVVKEVQLLQYNSVAIGALNVVKEVQLVQYNLPPNNVFNSPIIGIPYKLILVFAFS